MWEVGVKNDFTDGLVISEDEGVCGKKYEKIWLNDFKWVTQGLLGESENSYLNWQKTKRSLRIGKLGFKEEKWFAQSHIGNEEQGLWDRLPDRQISGLIFALAL